MQATLARLCPNLFENDKNPEICCDNEQIIALDESFELPEPLLSRCPSCFYNFKQMFCHLTCSKNQSSFLEVLSSEPYEDDGKQQLIEANYYISTNYANSLFDSCKSVGSGSGATALKLLCGTFDGSDCTPQKWLKFLGTSYKKGGYAPFQINFKYEQAYYNDSLHYEPINPKTYSCWQAVQEENLRRCSCSDCLQTCELKQMPAHVKELPQKLSKLMIFDKNASFVYSVALFTLACLFILGYFINLGMKKTKKSFREYNLCLHKQLITNYTNHIDTILWKTFNLSPGYDDIIGNVESSKKLSAIESDCELEPLKSVGYKSMLNFQILMQILSHRLKHA